MVVTDKSDGSLLHPPKSNCSCYPSSLGTHLISEGGISQGYQVVISSPKGSTQPLHSNSPHQAPRLINYTQPLLIFPRAPGKGGVEKVTPPS